MLLGPSRRHVDRRDVFCLIPKGVEAGKVKHIRSLVRQYVSCMPLPATHLTVEGTVLRKMSNG